MDDNTNIPANDVNITTDTTTAGGSSPDTQQTPVIDPSNQNTQDSGDNNGQTQENTGTPAPAPAHQDAVPYQRFSELNENFKQTQQELRAMREQQNLVLQQQQQFVQSQMPQQDPNVAAAKQQLKGLIQELAPELGFVSKAEIDRQQAISEVENTHNQLAAKYSGKADATGVVMPKYDKQAVLDYALKLGMTNAAGLEIAYKQMHEGEIMNARLAQMLQQTKGVKSETSNGTGSANTGVSDDDLKKAAQEGNNDAVHLLLKRRLAGK